MKKLCAAILFLPLFWSSVLATDSVVVGLGSASGKTTVSESESFSDILLGHDTTGSSWNVEYQKTLENRLLFGGGYQNFEVSGGTKFLFTEVKTDKFQVSGIYGVVGYNLEAAKNLLFQPSLRLGIANRLEAKYSRSSFLQGTTSISGSISGTVLGIVLPFVYQLENFNIGGQLLLPVAGLILKDNTGDETTFELSTALQLVVSYNFEL